MQQNGNSDVDVDDIMDMVDDSDKEDHISGYLDSIEKRYETKAARSSAETKKEVVSQNVTAVESEEEEQSESEEEDVEQQDAQPENVYHELAGHSYIENLVLIRKKKAKLQEEVAMTSDAVMSHPEANITRLKRLFTLLDTSISDPEYGIIFFNVQQTVTESLCVIFNDIIPNYR